MRYSSKKSKRFFIVVLFLLLVIGVGFAYLSSKININGFAKLMVNSWDVHFENVQIPSGSIATSETISIPSPTTVSFTSELNLPGDVYEFNIDVVNNGTIDAMIGQIDVLPVLTEEQLKYLEYDVTWEGGIQVRANDPLPKGEKLTLNVRMAYKSDLTAEDLPSEDKLTDMEIELDYVQAEEEIVFQDLQYAVMGSNAINTIRSNVIPLIQTAEGSLSETHSYLQSINELTVQATDSTSSASDLTNISADINDLVDQIEKQLRETTYEGKVLFSGDYVGDNAVVADFTYTKAYLELSGINLSTLGIGHVDFKSSEEATNYREKIWSAMSYISYYRSYLGVHQNSYEYLYSHYDYMIDEITSDKSLNDKEKNIIKSGLGTIKDILARIQELEYRAGNGTSSDFDRKVILAEIECLVDAIDIIVEDSAVNGKTLFTGDYEGIPNISTKHLGVDDGNLIVDFSSTEGINNSLKSVTAGFKKLNAMLNIREEIGSQVYQRIEGNLQDFVSLFQTVEGSASEMDSILNRMKELCSRNTEYPGDTDLTAINQELKQLIQEIDRITSETNFNGLYLLSGEYVGSKALNVKLITTDIAVEFPKLNATVLGVNGVTLTDTNGSECIALIQGAIDKLSIYRGDIGVRANQCDLLIGLYEGMYASVSLDATENEKKLALAKNGINSMSENLTRVMELENALLNDDVTETGRVSIANEINIISKNVDIIVKEVKFNGAKLLNGTYASIPNLSLANLGSNGQLFIDVSSEENIIKSLRDVEAALDKVNALK